MTTVSRPAPISLPLSGRRVLVVGLGCSGRAAARLCLREGASVTCNDRRDDVEAVPGCRMVAGTHRAEDFLAAELIVVSPGVPASLEPLRRAVAAGVPVIGELGLAAERLTAPIVGVTGTNGKSTVTHFTGQLLGAAGLRAFVGGNIGRPLCEAVEGGPWDAVVAEISSYQLEWPGTLAPSVACILNLTPDHLARHGDLISYGAAKARIFDLMPPEAAAILPAGVPLLADLATGHGCRRLWIGQRPGVWLDGDALVIDRGLGDGSARISLGALRVPGRHNRENAAVAALLAAEIGVPPERLDPGCLTALEHRMEIVASHGGITWINDSKATNVAAALTGLGGLGRPALVLLGGDGKKGEDYAALARVLRESPALICFGRSGPQLAAALSALPVRLVESMAQAVQLARQLAVPGDVVVLSPACASFDEFDNFEHRGAVFRDLVREMR